MTRITRVEVITNNGREYIHWEDDNDITYMLQDSNRTLKIFVGKAPPEQPMTEEENEKYFEEAKQIVENHFAKKKMTEKERIEGEIKVLEKKLSLLEEIEKHKTPCEEAFKRVFSYDPEGCEKSFWIAFQKGYEAATQDYKVGEYQEEQGTWNYDPDAKFRKQEEVEKLQEKDWEIKVETDYLTGKARHKLNIVDKDGNDYKPEPLTTEELLKPNWKPKPQTEEQVEEGLKKAFVEAQKTEKWKETQKLIDSPWMNEMVAELKGKTLSDLIHDWWSDIFTTGCDWDMETSIDELCNRISDWLPSHQSAAGSQNAYVESAVEGYNDAINKIRRKLR